MRALLVIASIIATVGATICTESYWGFGFMRPSIHEAAWTINTVETFADVRCERSSRDWTCALLGQSIVAESVAACERDAYYCLSDRVIVALNARRLLHDRLPPPSPTDMRRLASALSSPSLIAPAEPGYVGDRVLAGTVVGGRTPDHTRVLLVGIEGREISNDHHPYYELLINAETGRIVANRRFYWDVAGLEGLELGPCWWLIVFALIFAPSFLVLALARRALRARLVRVRP